MDKIIEIGQHKIGSGQPCFVIAEAGVNHNGDINLALQLVEVAARAGANAVKFQTFTANNLASPSAPKADYQLKTTDAAESQYEMLRRLELSTKDHQRLLKHSIKNGILFMSTPFDEDSANMLDELNIPAFKIPSGEITNLPFLAHVAQKGKPLIVSTGMSDLKEVQTAIRTIAETGNQQLVLLHCVSCYPATAADVNLNAMRSMADAFGLPVGYSDHTCGIEIPLAAIALGAVIVEKHFTLDRNLPGPDHRASLEPDELAKMVKGIRKVESALGNGCKRPTKIESKNAFIVRRSLVAARDIAAGEILTEEMIAVKRPGSGLRPDNKRYLIGRKLKHNIKGGSLLKMEMLA